MHQFEQLHSSIGPEAFTQQIIATAPYFGSIDPVLTKLVAGTAEVSLRKQPKVQNQKGMTVAYLAKAKSDLRVVTEAQNIDFSIIGDIVVPVAAYDEDGTKVFTADITMNVKHS